MLRMKLEGANLRARVTGTEEMSGRSNYLVGADPRGWRTGVSNYGRVKYESIYKGVDLVYYGNQRQLEFDFNVAPAADPGVIRLSFKGAQALRLDEQGDLWIETAAGSLRQHKPVAYQLVDGERREVACAYLLERGGRASFKLGAYDTSRELVIDPVLSYATYLGGNNTDEANAVAVDEQGNAYVDRHDPLHELSDHARRFSDLARRHGHVHLRRLRHQVEPGAGRRLLDLSRRPRQRPRDRRRRQRGRGARLAGNTGSPTSPSPAHSRTLPPRRRSGTRSSPTSTAAARAALPAYLGGTRTSTRPCWPSPTSATSSSPFRTFSSDFPVAGVPFQMTFSGGNLATNLWRWLHHEVEDDAGLSCLSTYLGGAGDDLVGGIALFNSGDGRLRHGPYQP